MRITLVAMGTEQLGLELLSAALQQRGHAVTLAFDPALFDDLLYFQVPALARALSRRAQVVRDIVASRPDIVGFSVITDNFRWGLDLARAVRQQLAVPVIFGGAYPSANPRHVLAQAEVDYACVGEGVPALPDLLDALARGDRAAVIPNIWAKGPDGSVREAPQRAAVPLGDLPQFDKNLFAGVLPLGWSYLTIASRGCPFRCSFCSQSYLQKLQSGNTREHYYEQRPLDHLFAELAANRDRCGIHQVEFWDNTFTADRAWALAFCARYARELPGIPFKIMTHPNCIDRELAEALRRAGCFKVQFGIQTMNEQVRKEALFRPETNAQIRAGLEACEAAGLPYSLDHMFGLPGETETDNADALRFYATLKHCMRVTCFWLSYFPHTPMLDLAVRRGLVSSEEAERINNVEAGEHALYIYQGSVRDPQKILEYRGYQLLFRAAPLLPSWLLQRWSSPATARRLGRIPRFPLLYLIDGLVSLKHNDGQGFAYLKQYAWQLWRLVQ